MSEVLRRVIETAQRNGGIITRGEAIALGLTKSSIRRRVQDGVFVDRRRGVLGLPGAEDIDMVDLRIACLKLNAVVSHQSAARLHGLDSHQAKPTVSVPIRRTKELTGVTVHQLTDLSEDHIVQVGGLPVTSPERTILDLAAVLSEGHISRILDNSLAARLVDLTQLNELFATLARRGKPGTVKMRRLLELRGVGYVPPESELERRLCQLIEVAGLPAPVRQFEAPWLRSAHGRVDLAYPGKSLVIEGDSRRWHMLADAFETDRLRDNAAQLAGWRILRFTWDEITKTPERVVITVRDALQV